MIDDSLVGKCYQSLDDSRVYKVCVLWVKFNTNLSHSEMTRPFSIKIKTPYTHCQGKKNKDLESIQKFQERSFKKPA